MSRRRSAVLDHDSPPVIAAGRGLGTGARGRASRLFADAGHRRPAGGSSDRPRRPAAATTSSPISSAAPATIASAASSRSWRWTILRWICASRSSSSWRPRSELTSSSVRRVCASARAIPRRTAVSSTVNGSSRRAPAPGVARRERRATARHRARRPTASGSTPGPMLASTSPCEHGARLGVERLGRAVDPDAQRALDVLARAKRGQVFGELLRGPAVVAVAHASARTTSVWL